jgi:hypothetical protein
MALGVADNGSDSLQPKSSTHLLEHLTDPGSLAIANSAASKFAQESYTAAPPAQASPKADPWSQWARDTGSGVLEIGVHVAEGAGKKLYDDVVNNPRQALLTLAEGVAVGAVVVAAAPVAAALGAGAGVVAGIGAVSEGAMLLLTASSVAQAAVETVGAASAAGSAADILMHRSLHSAADVAKARNEIEAKTGDAALSVAFAGAMALGAVGIVGKFAKFGDTASVAAVEGTTNGAVERLPKLGFTTTDEGMSRKEAFNAASAQAMESADGALESTKPGRERSSESYKMPAGTVEHLSQRISSYLEERTKKFDVAALRELIADKQQEGFRLREEFSSTGLDPAVYLRLSRSTKTREEVVAMRETINDKPEASQIFERYLQIRKDVDGLRGSLTREFSQRRAGLAQIVNEEVSNLWPDEVVPKLRITRLEEGIHANAKYSKGQLLIKDSDLEMSVPYNPQLVGLIVHEAKHGEQEALIVRAIIDKVTNGDTTGRELTTEQLREVSRETTTAYKALPDFLLDDVNAKRAGRPLTPEQSDRAAALLKSKNELREAGHRHTAQKERLNRLQEEAEIFDQHEPWIFPGSLDFLEDSDLFPDGLPAELKDVKRDCDSLNPADYDAVDGLSSRAVPVVRKALKQAISHARKSVSQNYRDYRNWFHEVEAWNAGIEAKDRVATISMDFWEGAEEILKQILKDARAAGEDPSRS